MHRNNFTEVRYILHSTLNRHLTLTRFVSDLHLERQVHTTGQLDTPIARLWKVDFATNSNEMETAIYNHTSNALPKRNTI
ncbi:uncharacterized membrane protein YjgN (DUF898 family) [Paenibacillus sp. DS2363]